MAKPFVEGRVSIDVREWCRRGLMEPGQKLCWHWERDGREILFIIIEMDSDRVVLRQEYPPPGENSKQIVQPIWLSYTPCNYGGTRAWFRCPGLPCGRKVAVLYKAGKYFVCRSCCGLRYLSQRTSLTNRRLQAWKQVRKKRRIEHRSFFRSLRVR